MSPLLVLVVTGCLLWTGGFCARAAGEEGPRRLRGELVIEGELPGKAGDLLSFSVGERLKTVLVKKQRTSFEWELAGGDPRGLVVYPTNRAAFETWRMRLYRGYAVVEEGKADEFEVRLESIPVTERAVQVVDQRNLYPSGLRVKGEAKVPMGEGAGEPVSVTEWSRRTDENGILRVPVIQDAPGSYLLKANSLDTVGNRYAGEMRMPAGLLRTSDGAVRWKVHCEILGLRAPIRWAPAYSEKSVMDSFDSPVSVRLIGGEQNAEAYFASEDEALFYSLQKGSSYRLELVKEAPAMVRRGEFNDQWPVTFEEGTQDVRIPEDAEFPLQHSVYLLPRTFGWPMAEEAAREATERLLAAAQGSQPVSSELRLAVGLLQSYLLGGAILTLLFSVFCLVFFTRKRYSIGGVCYIVILYVSMSLILLSGDMPVSVLAGRNDVALERCQQLTRATVQYSVQYGDPPEKGDWEDSVRTALEDPKETLYLLWPFGQNTPAAWPSTDFEFAPRYTYWDQSHTYPVAWQKRTARRKMNGPPGRYVILSDGRCIFLPNSRVQSAWEEGRDNPDFWQRFPTASNL